MSRPPWRFSLLVFAITAIAVTYLVVQAPPPLAAAREEQGVLPIRTAFAILEHESDTARALWTEDIVDAGSKHGLEFAETWRDDTSHAGPLPALFLRETARHLEREAPGLRLFLGSRFPINSANQFTGEQGTYALALEATGAPQFFLEPSTQLQTAMFADRAFAAACVRCHNEHGDSPKTDWKRGDIMGATTWMYPQPTITVERAVELVAGLRRSIRAAYTSYLEKTSTFPRPPVIGDAWPTNGATLPSADAFMQELARRSSSGSLRALLEPFPGGEITAVAPVAVTPPPPPPPPPDVLSIHANRATTVTVEHRGARVLVARLRAGTTTTVASPPPLRVHVDDADDVTLAYRGAPVAKPEVEVVIDEDE